MPSYHKQIPTSNQIHVAKELLRRLDDIYFDAREGLLGLAYATGLAVFNAMMEEEVSSLVGDRGRHNPERVAYRHGTESGRVVVGSMKVPVTKPRVRTTTGKELPLETYEQFKAEEPMGQAAMERLLCGVTTRKYETVLDKPQDIEAKSVSRDSVSRQFIARTKVALDELLGRKLDDRQYVGLFIDGHGIGDYLVVTAIGVDSDGRKHVLGLKQGHTENKETCVALLSDLVERGLDYSQGLLVVVDGSKALRAAVNAIFGEKALIQRCQIHKMRNVLGYLPDNMKAEVKRQMTQAYMQTKASTARKLLENLAKSLDKSYPDAAKSLREGLDETLTMMRLDIPALLRKSFRSTNPIESAFDGTTSHTKNVKRWLNGEMVLRWMAAALMEVEKSFNRLVGYRDIPALMKILGKHAVGEKVLLPLDEAA